jgi:ATP synthase protein I
MSLIGPEGRKQLKLAARFASAGLELVISIVVGYFGGGLLDRWLGTSPYIAYVGLALGIAAGFRNLLALARSAQKRAEDSPAETDDSGPPPSNTPP